MSANPFPPGYINNLFKFGRAGALPLTTERIIWNTSGAYNGILANESALSIVSSSALDKAAGGGATQLVFFYQGEDGLEKTKVVTLNGDTPVDIPAGEVLADVSYRAFITASENNDDLNGANIGDITCYETGTPANILWQISAGEGQTLMCFYRVPSNKFFEVIKVKAFPEGLKSTLIRVRIKTNKTYPWRVQGTADTLNNIAAVEIEDVPQVIRPGGYIAITASAAQADTNVSAYFTGTLKDYLGADYYGGLVPF